MILRLTLRQELSILEPLDLEAGIADGDEAGREPRALVLLLLDVLQRQREHRLLEASDLFIGLPGLTALQLPDFLQALGPLRGCVEDILADDAEADGGESLAVLVVGAALVLAGVGLDQLGDVQSHVAKVTQGVNAGSLRVRKGSK